MSKNELVFDYLDKGDNFYIILEGSVFTVVPLLEPAEPNSTIKDAFGNLILTHTL